LRVLVVDGDPFVRLAVTRALRNEHDVIALESHELAWSRIEAGEPFDVLLCESQAGGFDAETLWSRLTHELAPTRARVVFLHGRTTKPEVRAFVASIAAPTLDKPLDPLALKALIAKRATSRLDSM